MSFALQVFNFFSQQIFSKREEMHDKNDINFYSPLADVPSQVPFASVQHNLSKKLNISHIEEAHLDKPVRKACSELSVSTYDLEQTISTSVVLERHCPFPSLCYEKHGNNDPKVHLNSITFLHPFLALHGKTQFSTIRCKFNHTFSTGVLYPAVRNNLTVRQC